VSTDLDRWQERWASAPSGAWRALVGALPPAAARVHGWVADAVYGANDGLGAVFGIVAGVSGYEHGGRIVLVSGLAGMLASALSMGAGAYLSVKAEHEVYQVEVARCRRRVAADAVRAAADLAEAYVDHGLAPQDAQWLARRLSGDPEALALALVREERGLAGGHLRHPLRAALTASLSTALGAFIPTVPFFFMDGTPAIAAAAGISLLAHFAVGAAKSAVVPALRWWVAGAEMTLIGAVEGAITYGIGLWASRLLPH
jgi:VIT1/CCC1 family predicted Fe2+/Mn2+ transporter